MREKLLKDIENRELCENDMVFYCTNTGTLRTGEVGIILAPNLILSLLGEVHNLSYCYKIEEYNSTTLKQLNESLLDIKLNYINEKQNFRKYGLIRGCVYRYYWQDVSHAVIYLGECKIEYKRDIIGDIQKYIGPLFLDIDLQYSYKEAQNCYSYYLDKLKSNISCLYENELNKFMKKNSSIYADLDDLYIEMDNNSIAIDRFLFNIQDFKTDKIKYDTVVKGRIYISTTITFL